MNDSLALVNALATLGTIACLALGYRAIRRREIDRHRNLMIGAFACSTVFLVLFVARFVLWGFRPFAGQGIWRAVYYGLLFGHEPIAVISIPLAVVTLIFGLLRSKVHIELARPTLVVWLLSSVTGVLLYVLLYLVSP